MPTIAAVSPHRAAVIARRPGAAAASTPSRAPAGSVVSIAQLIVEGDGDDTLRNYNAGAPVFGGYAVMFASATKVVHAVPTAPGYVLAGIATQSGGGGASIAVRSRGAFTFSGWSWTAGEPVFALAGGGLTQTAPDTGVLHQVGFALDATTLLIESGEPVYL